MLVLSDLTSLDFRNALADIGTLLVVEPIHAAVSAFNCKCAANELILGLLGPRFDSFHRNGDLLLRHITDIPFFSFQSTATSSAPMRLRSPSRMLYVRTAAPVDIDSSMMRRARNASRSGAGIGRKSLPVPIRK
jgi:hypothetical protein